MAFLECNIESKTLGMRMHTNIIMPVEYSEMKNVPTLYLLHGLKQNCSCWMRFSSIERYVKELNLAVVMPEVHRSFYMNLANGQRYYDYISEELIENIEAMFPVSRSRSDRFCAGLSMGGYGALKLGLTAPYKFAGAASMSGAVDIEYVYNSVENPMERLSSFGKEIAPENNLYRLAEKAAEDCQMPAVFQCCGTEDYLYEANTAYRDFIKELCPDYTYAESAGEHNWDFWDEYIQRILAWMIERNPRIMRKSNGNEDIL